MELSDEDVMMRLRKGDTGALESLMDRYQRMLVNHFRRRGVHDQYEDLAQETFFRIYKARKRYRPTAAFRTWMFKVAERVWIDYVRKSARKDRRENAYRAEPHPAHRSPDPQRRNDVLWALEQLPAKQRDVVVLSYFDGLAQTEVAEILEIPEGTVKSRLHHATKRLKDIFEDEQP